MRIFHCDHCQHLVYFENVSCLKCGHALAYLPDLTDIVSLEEAGENLWRSPAPAAAGRTFRLCRNYSQENICNWAVAADDPNPLCRSCRLTTVVTASDAAGKSSWYRLEVAKRRLVYSLLALRLPMATKVDDPKRGLAFKFLADDPSAPGTGAPGAPGTPGMPATPVLTGHREGVITINMAEADDVEREKRRVAMHEPYRTLLGHFRHEVGHYYWDRLIRGSERIDGFRRLFGDERRDYAQALERHYQDGPPADWQQFFVSAYASAHPWEDWAETWAHYLHMTDALEMAAASGLAMRPRRPDEPALKLDPPHPSGRLPSFDPMIENWFSLTNVMNNLNRGLGLPDGYPFILSTPSIEKLHFVHAVIAAAR